MQDMNHEPEKIDYPLPQIKSMGSMLFDPIWAERMHLAAGLEILHMVKGEVELQTTRTRHRAGDGETLMVPSGTMHRDGFDPARGVHIFFCSIVWPSEIEDAYFSLVNNTTLLNMNIQAKADIHAIFRNMELDLKGGTQADNLVSRSRILLVLMISLREAVRMQTSEHRESNDSSFGRERKKVLLEQAKAYVLQHYREPISLNQVAEALRVSGYHLSHVFSEMSDLSLFSYLTNVRMDRARKLLGQGKLNVAEVSRAVGYSDANYFSKAFRKHCGCSPRQFAAAGLRET